MVCSTAASAVNEKEVFANFIRQVRLGDQQAAEELVRLYEPLVRRELRIKMTDRRMARLFDTVDVCQSIWSSFFARAAAGQYDLNNSQQLAKLLVTMARNKLATQARRNHALKRDINRATPSPSQLAILQDPDDSPSVQATIDELYTKIQARLSPEERRVSELRRDGLSWEDVAETLGGTAQARRMQLDRAADRVLRQLGLSD